MKHRTLRSLLAGSLAAGLLIVAGPAPSPVAAAPPSGHLLEAPATTGTMSGTVTSGAGATPVGLATVRVISALSPFPTFASVQTSPTGDWSVPGVPFGNYVVSVVPLGRSAPFYVGAGYVNPFDPATIPTIFTLGAASPAFTGVVANLPVTGFTGTVNGGSSTVAGGVVEFVDPSSFAVFSDIIEPDGSYSIEFLPLGEYEVFVTLPAPSTFSFRASTATLTTGIQTLNLTIPTGSGRISGVVRSGNAPAGNVRVGVFRSGGENFGFVDTEPDGSFTLTDLPDGNFGLYVQTGVGFFYYGSGYAITQIPTLITIAGGAPRSGIEIALPDGGFDITVASTIEPFASEIANGSAWISIDQTDGDFAFSGNVPPGGRLQLIYLPIGSFTFSLGAYDVETDEVVNFAFTAPRSTRSGITPITLNIPGPTPPTPTPPTPPTPPTAPTPSVPLVSAVAPSRLHDTRPAATTDGKESNTGRRVAGSTTTIQVTGRGNVPADATAVTVNVVAVNPGAAGFMTIYPCGSPRPEASTLNFAAGQTIANGATIKLGASGTICVFTDQATDLLLDVTGFVPAGSIVGTVVPARLHDTRPAATIDAKESNTGRRVAGSTTTIQVAGRGNIPANASAATVNVVAINPGAAGFFTIYPCGSDRPEASTLNFAAGQTVANSATIKLGTGGTICVYSDQATDLLLDVTGFLPAGAGAGTVIPARLHDTRPATTVDGKESNTGRRVAGSTTTIQVSGRGNIPAGASAALVNVVAINPGAAGFFTIYPCGSDRPEASTLNFAAGQTIANGAIIKLGTGGTICVYTDQATDLLLDVTGFVPAT